MAGHKGLSHSPQVYTLSSSVNTCVKNLGVLLDSVLKLDKKVNSVVRSCFFYLCLLTKVQPFLCPQAFEWVIHAFFSSRLDYCDSLCYGINSTTLARLQIIQNAAVRLLKGICKHEHITPILASLHWLPVRFMVDFKILLLVYKCLNNLAPLYLSELLVQYNPSRGLRSGTQKLLSIPRYRLKHRGHCAFAISGPE